MSKKQRYTKNIKVTMYLAECEHEASLIVDGRRVVCDVCGVVPQKRVGTILVSLDKEGFLTAKMPLKAGRAEQQKRERIGGQAIGRVTIYTEAA